MQHSNPFDDDEIGMCDFLVNPANGYPMIDGMGGVDVAGNAFGMDSTFDPGIGSPWD